MNPFILPAMSSIASLLFLSKDGFGIKWPMKLDMPLNKATCKNKYAQVKQIKCFHIELKNEQTNIYCIIQKWVQPLNSFFIEVYFFLNQRYNDFIISCGTI